MWIPQPGQVPTPLLRPARLLAAVGADLAMSVWPDGGQGTARRNAWAAMVANSERARARAAAEATLELTQPVASRVGQPVAGAAFLG